MASRKTASVEGSVGERVREMREARDLTLDTVADAAAISSPYLSRIETGHQLPARETFQAIARQVSEEPGDLVEQRDQAELENLGYPPEAAEVAAAIRRLDPEQRRRLAAQMAGMLEQLSERSSRAD